MFLALARSLSVSKKTCQKKKKKKKRGTAGNGPTAQKQLRKRNYSCRGFAATTDPACTEHYLGVLAVLNLPVSRLFLHLVGQRH